MRNNVYQEGEYYTVFANNTERYGFNFKETRVCVFSLKIRNCDISVRGRAMNSESYAFRTNRSLKLTSPFVLMDIVFY